MLPIIFHIDMNSYFATVAQQENPAWRGKPLGVCEHLGGMIIAASVDAKKWGIKTGTPVWEAKKIYPKIILTKTLPNSYRKYIKEVVRITNDYTDKVEQASIDELYADMTRACNIRIVNSKKCLVNSNPYEEAIKIAREIKRRIKKEVGDYLTCSIGIADNKLVAKIGSDLKKPDGLVVVGENKYQVANNINNSVLWMTKDQLYNRLKLTDIPGIARRQEKRLNALGIKTLLDLKNFPAQILVRKFGIHGYHLHKMGQLNGSWKASVQRDDIIKSIGHMYTVPRAFRTPEYFYPVLYKLCEMVAKRLRKQGLMGNIIHFFWRPAGSMYSRAPKPEKFSLEKKPKTGASKNLGFYVFDGREIFLQAKLIHQQLLAENHLTNIEYRLIGITVAGLKPQSEQKTLWGSEEKLKRVVGALDKINSKYGDFTIVRTPLIYAKGVFHDSVGFGRVKER